VRRTDFYYEAEPGDRMGFPPKYAESLIYQFYKKYQDEHQKKHPSKGLALEKRWDEFKAKSEKAQAEIAATKAAGQGVPAPKQKQEEEEEKEPQVYEVIDEPVKNTAPKTIPPPQASSDKARLGSDV